MKKLISFALVAAVLAGLMCLTSCGNKRTDGVSVSSGTAYTENDVSQIAKTESDGSFTFAFDPYVLPENIKKSLGETALYKKIANAILEHDEKVTLSSRDDYDNIRFALGEAFPFSSVIKNYKYELKNNCVDIEYKYDKEKCDVIIKNFKQEVQRVFSENVKNTDGQTVAAILLYSWMAQNIVITDSEKITDNADASSGVSSTSASVPVSSDSVSSDLASSAYMSSVPVSSASSEISQENNKASYSGLNDTLIDKKGSALSVSSLYSYLLMQLGIESRTVGCWNGEIYRAWNIIRLGSKWYYCDIAGEQKATEGKGLSCFGMSEEALSQRISYDKLSMGEWKWYSEEMPKANSERFKDFKSVTEWTLNQSRDGISAATAEGSHFNWSD